MAAVEEYARCPCIRADEDLERSTSGEPNGHWLMVRREVFIDYNLGPFDTEVLPSEDELAALLVADELNAEAEALDRTGAGCWTVTCERAIEEGETVQAMFLRDAVRMWLQRWQA